MRLAACLAGWLAGLHVAEGLLEDSGPARPLADGQKSSSDL